MPQKYQNLGKEIEELKYLEKITKEHLPIWKSLIVKQYTRPIKKNMIDLLEDSYDSVLPSIYSFFESSLKIKLTRDEFVNMRRSLLLSLFIEIYDKKVHFGVSNKKSDGTMYLYPMFLILELFKIRNKIDPSSIERPYIEDKSIYADRSEEYLRNFYFFKLLQKNTSNLPKDLNKILESICNILDQINEGNYCAKEYKQKLLMSSKLFFEKSLSAVSKQLKTQIYNITLFDDKVVNDRIFKFFMARAGYYIESLKEEPDFLIYASKHFY